MPLQTGTRIGGYEIVAPLGAGGMGEVYRARDARLGRDVAIKVLSPHIAADAEALQRFEREARALASLNHQNIAAIYGVEGDAAQPALVLELVDGETLADRIARGPVPISEAIDCARQIADALDVAHEAGIVHRDLKPGNVKITEDGRIKVLDFGLAKAVAAAAGERSDLDPANSPTITVHGTRQGVILGTAAYMSPEQARGKRVDKRTDIWAFGCVLFEMLTGNRAFDGETTSDVIAAVIERPPDLRALPPSTPAHVQRLIARCLEKDPKRRARDIGDVRAEIDRADAAAPSSRRVPLIAALAVVTVAAIAVALVTWRSRSVADPPATPVEFTFGPPPGHTLAAQPAVPSPDGRHLAFMARDDKGVESLFLRSLDSAAVRQLEGTQGTSGITAWSPDSRALAFFAANAWRRIDIAGGPPITIVPGVANNLGGTWSADGTLLIAPSNRTALARVPVTGGSLQAVTTLDPQIENSHRWPHWLPDARHFLFTIRSDRADRLGIRIGTLDSTDARMLVNVASPGIYVEPGWLLFMTPDEVLMAQRIDRSTWTMQGPAQPIAGPVHYNGPSFNGAFHASRDGRVVTFVPAAPGASTLEWFDRAGATLGRLGPERDYRAIRLSPDDRRVAVELADSHLGTRDLWLVDTSTQALARLTTHPATDWRPTFSPDGGVVAFASDRAGLSTVLRGATDGGGPETSVFRGAEGGAFPSDWSRDGRSILVHVDDRQGHPATLLTVPATGGPPVTLIEREPGGVILARFAPNADRVAYVSRGSGSAEVYVMSLADKQRVRVSADGGTNPLWGADGRELFFETGRGEIMRAVLDGMTVSDKPAVLFRPCTSIGRTYPTAEAELKYAINRDATRFLAICQPLDAVPSFHSVVVNWQAKLRN